MWPRWMLPLAYGSAEVILKTMDKDVGNYTAKQYAKAV